MNLDSIRKMDKGELHVHLNGLVSTETIKKIVQSESCEIPKNFDVSVDLNVLRPAQSLVDYLLPWQVLRLIPKSRR